MKVGDIVILVPGYYNDAYKGVIFEIVKIDNICIVVNSICNIYTNYGFMPLELIKLDQKHAKLIYK